jgi:hypothetical protein
MVHIKNLMKAKMEIFTLKSKDLGWLSTLLMMLNSEICKDLEWFNRQFYVDKLDLHFAYQVDCWSNLSIGKWKANRLSIICFDL